MHYLDPKCNEKDFLLFFYSSEFLVNNKVHKKPIKKKKSRAWIAQNIVVINYNINNINFHWFYRFYLCGIALKYVHFRFLAMGTVCVQKSKILINHNNIYTVQLKENS